MTTPTLAKPDRAASAAAAITATVTLTNSTADLDVVDLLIPANTLVAGAVYRFALALIITNPAAGTGNTLTLWAKVGGTKVAALAVQMSTGAKTTQPTMYEGFLTIRSIGASGAFFACARVISNSPASPPFLAVGVGGTQAVDTTADLHIKVGGTWTTAASDSALAVQGFVEAAR